MRTIIRFILALLTILTVAVVVRTAIWGGPRMLYELRRPSTSSVCAVVHSGMTLIEVEDLVHSRNWPMQESLSANQFSFGAWDTCKVDLDPQTHKVVRAGMDQSPIQYNGDWR